MSCKKDEIVIFLAIHNKLYRDSHSDHGKRSDIYRALREIVRSRSDIRSARKFISSKDLTDAATQLESARSFGTSVVSGRSLKELHEVNPLVSLFFLKGKLPDNSFHPYIAIVGSRKATPYGREITETIVSDLSSYKASIVSGMAYGIDAAAHRAAIKYSLPTLAVLGCGIDVNYPAAHTSLASDIVDNNGAVISEFPMGMPPLPQNFPLRNRIISGLSRGVVVVEAEVRSGSLITARWAAEQGKEVFAVPGNIGRALSSGTNQLIKEGAYLVESGEEVAEILNLKRGEDLEKNPGHYDEDDDIKRAIKNYLKSGGNNLEILAKETGISVKELLPLITIAETEL